ncbi:hypothetical protein [Porphyromonas macacae]|nr:hypothetical protein [Porphyromonas macacae]
MKRNRFYIFLLLTSCFIAQLHAQRKLTIAVFDTQGNRLPYPEFIIGHDFHRVGTKDGTVEVSFDSTALHDLITVKYMGYKTTQIQLDSIHFSDKLINVNLEEDSYLLDPIIVVPSKFSAEKYFQERKKNLLLPYYRTYFFDLDFVLNENNKTDHFYTGHALGTSCRNQTDIDSASLVISEVISYNAKLLTILKRASEVSYLMANAFCHKSDRKNFYCTYMGSIDGFELWEFSIRKQKEMPWNLQEDDELRCIVSLDKDGFINRIKTQLTSSSEYSASYLLDTEFGLHKKKLIPSIIKIDLVPNARNEDLKSLSLVINYSNFRKEK